MPTGSHSTTEDSSTEPGLVVPVVRRITEREWTTDPPRRLAGRRSDRGRDRLAGHRRTRRAGHRIVVRVQSNDQEILPAERGRVGAGFRRRRALSMTPVSCPRFVIFETSGGAATPEQLAPWQAFTESLPSQPVDPAKPDLGTVGDYLVASPIPGQPVPIPLVPSQDGQAGLVLVPLSADKVTAVDADGQGPTR